MSTKEQVEVYTNTIDLLAKSFINHRRFKKVAASNHEPAISWHSSDSVIFTLMEKLGNVNVRCNSNLQNIIKVYSAFNLIWNSADFLLDNIFKTSPNISPGTLKTTPIEHKSGTYTIKDAQKMFIEGLHILKPDDRNFRLNLYKDIGLFRLNTLKSINCINSTGESILDYRNAYQIKEATTGSLAETATKVYCQILGIDEYHQESLIELGRWAGLSMQFGDDLIDWRKDYFTYLNQLKYNHGYIQPVDNLLLATLSENDIERNKILKQRFLSLPLPPALIIRLFAPITFKAISQRFKTQIEHFPQTENTPYLQNIFRFAFYRLTMVLPNSFGLDEK